MFNSDRVYRKIQQHLQYRVYFVECAKANNILIVYMFGSICCIFLQKLDRFGLEQT
jgi:hypothetical protein